MPLPLTDEDKARRIKIFNAVKDAVNKAVIPIHKEEEGKPDVEQKLFHDTVDALVAYVTEMVQVCYKVDASETVTMYRDIVQLIRNNIAKESPNVSIVKED